MPIYKTCHNDKIYISLIDRNEIIGDINSVINENAILNIETNYLMQFIDDYVDDSNVQSLLQDISKSIIFDTNLYI